MGWGFYAVIFGWLASDMSLTSLASEAENFFESRIRPVLVSACHDCHSEARSKSKGGLYLTKREHLLEGGDSGPALVPGDADSSLLMQAIRYTDPDIQMPPEKALDAQQIRDFETWINQGAVFPDTSFSSSSEANLPWWEASSESTLPSLDESAEEVIDSFILAGLQQNNLFPAPLAEESIRLRRLCLDLIGRPPTPAELRAYLFDSSGDKWARIVDQLLESPGFIEHQITELNWLLMGEDHQEFRAYLALLMREGRSWGQLYEEVILADYQNESAAGATAFLKQRVGDLDRLTNDVAMQFFGVNISCAQCHDHPNVPHWTQASYYGMKSFFASTFDNGGFVAERSEGKVSYKNTRGETLDADLRFLDRPALNPSTLVSLNDADRQAEKETFEQLKQEKLPATLPEASRRRLLVREALANDQGGYFARSAVNRLWKQFMGRGLVEPVDQMHGANLPSHPELLIWLSRWFQGHDYDMKALIRALVSSQSYQRSSQWHASERPAPSRFAVKTIRPLTPKQYAANVHMAASGMALWRDISPDSQEHQELLDKVLAKQSETAKWFERSSDLVHFTVEESLHMSNNPAVESLLHPKGSSLASELAGIPTHKEAIQALFWHILQRSPKTEETQALVDVLEKAGPDKTSIWRTIIWSMTTGPENRFNH